MDPFSIILGFAGLGANYAGASANADAVEQTNAANAQQAALNREFQHYMSGTAHYREMQDLHRSGLNPIMAAMKGGATTPGGATANMVAPRPGDKFSAAAASAVEARKLSSELELQDAATYRERSQEDVNDKQAKLLFEKQKEQRMLNEALEMDLEVKKVRNLVDMKQAGWDLKAVDFDNYLSRGSKLLKSAGDAASMVPSAKGVSSARKAAEFGKSLRGNGATKSQNAAWASENGGD